MNSQDEYKLSNGQSISIQNNDGVWEVAYWNDDDTCNWYKEFDNEQEARKEYERFRP